MKKILLTLLATTILLSLIICAVYATSDESVEEAEPAVTSEMLSTSSKIFTTLDSNQAVLDTEVSYDEMREKDIYKISNSEYTLNLDSSNNLVGIYSTEIKSTLTSSSSTENEAEEIIRKIYNELNLPSEYELVYLETLDELVWEADFQKNYDGIYNKYEAVKIFFIPDTEELITLSIFDEGYDDGTVTISEGDAISTATENLDIDSSDIISATLSMEKANSYYNESSTDTSVHTSWILQTSDNEFIYVDASDNTIIGGDCINE